MLMIAFSAVLISIIFLRTTKPDIQVPNQVPSSIVEPSLFDEKFDYTTTIEIFCLNRIEKKRFLFIFSC
jgi:hypothetical protein